MEQLGKHRSINTIPDRKGYVRTRPLYSTVYSPRTRGSSNARDGRVVFPGHVIQLRYDITMHRAKALLNCLPTNQPNLAKAAGRLKSARLLPMGIVHNNNEEKCLGIVTARQAPSRASTMPAIPTSNSKATARDDGTRRRVHSAVPSSRTTNMNIDDLLTISATNVNTSKCKVLLHKRLLNQRSQHHDQRSQHHMDEDTEHKQEDESVQNSESMATVTENDIKVRVVLGHQSQSKQQTELPTLPENNKQESKHSTNKQSVMKKSCSKLSPLTGAHCKLPIGTLNGNSFYLTCKNKSS